MQQLAHKGIVLKRHIPEKQKITIFDDRLGKIEGIVLGQTVHRLCHGALAIYYLEHVRYGLVVHAVDLIHVPFDLARHDILFLHHVLELAYCFVPLHDPHVQLFELLCSLYVISLKETVRENYLLKKCFLVKFLLMIGFCPDEEESEPLAPFIKNLPIDEPLYKNIDLELEKKLDTWLLRCIQQHPHMHQLKTVYFLDQCYRS